MKSVVFFTLIFLLFFMKDLNAQTNWDYKVYKTITQAGVKLFTLEYGIKSNGYDGYVKWRLTNHTNKAIYDVSINDKTYTLSDGSISSNLGETLPSTNIEPGESRTFPYDPVNSAEYVLNSDENFDNPVKSVRVNSPEISFKDKKNGDEHGWDSSGMDSSKKDNANNKGNSENTSNNYNQSLKKNTLQQRTYSENNTTSGSYNKSSNYSSQNTSENNSNDYWEQWADDYKKEASNNEAEYQQSLNNLSNAIVGIAQEYQRANEEAKQREREEERRREAEEEQRAAERRKIYNAKVNAMNNMDAFEKDFQSYFNKDINRASSSQAIYFYFGTVKKYFDSKSGNLYLSNIFPVYKVSANRWPFISDIINEIENNYGNVIMRGYFTSLHEANRDRENIIAYAKNSYFKNIYEKQYQFQFNKPTSNNSETDYWGNKVSNEEKNTKKTDFWGNVVESESGKYNEESGKTNTKTKEQPKTDFWGNVIETGDKKETEVNLNPPTIEKIKKIMQDFSFDNKERQVSISEAERILNYLGVEDFRKDQHQSAEPFLYGKLNENYAITIWVGTYGKADRYGVRFGKSDYSYHGNNDSYFEIIIP